MFRLFSPGLGAAAAHLQRWLGNIAAFSFRHALLTLGLLALVGAGASAGAGRLSLDPDISQLLPPSHESVQHLDALRERFGGVGNVAVLVSGGTPEARRRYAELVAPALEKLDTVSYVDFRRPTEFFEDRALYFMDRADLETMRDRLDARRRYQVERAMLDLDDEEAPSVDMSDLVDKYRSKLDEIRGTKSQGERRYYEDDSALALLVRPTELASNLTFSQRVVADVERVLGDFAPQGRESGLEIELGGRYKKRVDLQAVLGRDLAKTGLLAMLLVVGWVAFHFRRLSAVLLVMAPLSYGLMLVYAIAGFGFGTLNVLTAFVGAILLGIGIDNGIHILGRYDEARREGAAADAAVRDAFSGAGRVSLAAALTTATAFGCLALSDFRAFREFGVLAAAGMLLVLGSYLTLLPALLGLVSRHLPALGAAPGGPGLPGIPRLLRVAPWLLAGVATLFVVVSAHAPAVQFDADFAALDRADLPSFRMEPTINRLFGRSQTPLVVLAESDADAKSAAAELRVRMKELGSHATLSEVVTVGDLVPDDQLSRTPILARIRGTLSHIDLEQLGEKERSDTERLMRMAEAEPFARADLPSSVRKPFEPRDGSGPAFFVLAYPSVSMSDGGAVRALAKQLEAIDIPGGRTLSAVGEPMVMADILDIVERDAPRIVFLTLVLVLIVLRVTAGSFTVALLSALPALITFTATAGALAIFGIDLNYLNMVMLPILLGIAVDDGMHIVSRVAEGDALGTVWTHTGWNVFGAVLTDIFGFGVLAFAEHPGLQSIGAVALVGLGVNLLACLLFLPPLLASSPGIRQRLLLRGVRST